MMFKFCLIIETTRSVATTWLTAEDMVGANRAVNKFLTTFEDRDLITEVKIMFKHTDFIMAGRR